MKKEYIVPTVEIFDFYPENMIAESVIQGGEGEEFNPDVDFELSNKRQPDIAALRYQTQEQAGGTGEALDRRITFHGFLPPFPGTSNISAVLQNCSVPSIPYPKSTPFPTEKP